MPTSSNSRDGRKTLFWSYNSCSIFEPDWGMAITRTVPPSANAAHARTCLATMQRANALWSRTCFRVWRFLACGFKPWNSQLHRVADSVGQFHASNAQSKCMSKRFNNNANSTNKIPVNSNHPAATTRNRIVADKKERPETSAASATHTRRCNRHDWRFCWYFGVPGKAK